MKNSNLIFKVSNVGSTPLKGSNNRLNRTLVPPRLPNLPKPPFLGTRLAAIGSLRGYHANYAISTERRDDRAPAKDLATFASFATTLPTMGIRLMTMDQLDDSHARVLRQMCDAVGFPHERAMENDVFVGFFQSFRPDGNGLKGIFDGLPEAADLQERLADLFEAAGDDRRPQGGRDAYFVVRQPAEMAPQLVEAAGRQWITRLGELAKKLGHTEAVNALSNVETIRVLEGIAPKHPKLDHDKTNLLRLLKDEIPLWLENLKLETTSHQKTRLEIADSLRPSYYFVNCDPMLRDFLMWPLYREPIPIVEPMEPYYQLWKHGVKWRVYQEKQVDLYMPRP